MIFLLVSFCWFDNLQLCFSRILLETESKNTTVWIRRLSFWPLKLKKKPGTISWLSNLDSTSLIKYISSKWKHRFSWSVVDYLNSITNSFKCTDLSATKTHLHLFPSPIYKPAFSGCFRRKRIRKAAKFRSSANPTLLMQHPAWQILGGGGLPEYSLFYRTENKKIAFEFITI